MIRDLWLSSSIKETICRINMIVKYTERLDQKMWWIQALLIYMI